MAWKKRMRRAASAKPVRPDKPHFSAFKGAVVAASIPLALAGVPAVSAFAAPANGAGQAQSGTAQDQGQQGSGAAANAGTATGDAASASDASGAGIQSVGDSVAQAAADPSASNAASETDLLPTEKVAQGQTQANTGASGLAGASGNVTIIVQLDAPKGLLDSAINAIVPNANKSRHQRFKDAIKELVGQQLATMSADGGEDQPVYQEIHDYYYAIDGFAVKAPASLLPEIQQMDGVKHAFVEQQYSIPADQGEQPALKNQSSLDMTGADKVSETGKGQVIAVIDSGLDTDHEAFQGDLDDASTKVKGDEATKKVGHGVSISEKIPFVRDYADNDDDVNPSSVSGMEHGTHVSGIATANSGSQIRGTAPDAQLMMLKVAADSNGAIYDSAMLAALDDAVKLNVDSVNMSLGSDAGFADNPTYEDALASLRKTGATINVAAGNSTTSALGNKSGQNLPYASDPDSSIISSPAADVDSFAVASIDNSERSPFFTAADGTKMAYLNASMIDNSEAPQFSSLDDGTYEYVDGGQGTDSDLTNLQDQYPTGLAGKIALVQRGGTNADGSNTTFAQKVNNMEKLGVAAVVIYDNADGNPSRFGVDNKAIPTVMITKANGEKLKAAETKTITVKQGETMEPSTAYTMSSYSSWGVTPDLKLKPEVTAPGGNIWSSIPNNQYEYMSGTSMATPQMAGISAQIQQYVDSDAKFSGMSAEDKANVVTQLLMSTAEPVADPAVSDGAAYSPRWQGAGLANVQAAVSTPAYLTVDGATDVSRPKADLGDSADGSWTFTVEVHNLSDSEATYKADAQALSEQVQDGLFRMHETNWTGKGIDVTFGGDAATDGTLKVAAKGTAKLTVSVKAGQAFTDWAAANTPNGTFVEGFVQLKAQSDGAVDLAAPYLGFYGNWGTPAVFDAALWDSANTHIYGSTLASPTSGQTLGINPLTDTTAGVDPSQIDKSKFVVSNTSYSTSPSAAYPLTGTLRNVLKMTYDWKDADGKSVKKVEVDRLSKAHYNAQSGQVYYAEATISTEEQGKAAFDGKDGNGAPLPDGTYTLTQTGTTAGPNSTDQANQAYDGLTVQYDTTAPKVTNVRLSGEGDDRVMTFDVSDKSYLAAVQLNTPGVGGYFYRVLDSDAALKDLKPDVAEDGTKTWHVSLKVSDIEAAWDSTQQALGTNDPLPNSVPLVAWDYGLNAGTGAKGVLNPVPATGVTLSKDEVTLAAGQTGKLDATIAPADTTQTDLTWTSSDDEVVTVDESGNLKGIANGTATITVTVDENPELTATAQVTVANVSAETGIVMAESSASVSPEGTQGVTALVSPEIAAELKAGTKKVEWTSADPSVASVKADASDSTKAVVTGGSQIGDTKITATVEGKSASMDVSVRPADYGDFVIDENGKLTLYTGNAQHVVIPNNVKEIGTSAFQAAPMVDVYVPKSVERIDDHAFASAPNLTTVNFEEGSKLSYVGDGAFYYTLKLDTVNLPDSVTSMGTGVFEQSTIRHARMAGLREIPASTFASSAQLYELTISDDVTTIGDNAFSATQSLGEFKLAHQQADGSYTVDAGASVMPSKLEAIGNSAFASTQFKTVDLTKTKVTTIGSHAFALLGGQVILNEGLTSVADYALAGTQNTEWVLPSTLTDVGYGAFSQTGSLKTVTLGKNVKADQLDAAFAYDNALTEFKLPEGGTENYDVIEGVLYNKAKTKLVAYPLALNGKDGVYTVPDGTTDIAEYAFAHAYNLSEVTFNEGLTTIGDSAFYEDKLTKVELPQSVEAVGKNTFAGNTLLTTVKLGGTKTLGAQAFGYSIAITELDFGTRLESIGDNAFVQVQGLRELIFPDTLTNIGNMGFANMPNLEKVHIGAGLTSGLSMAFTGDPNLSELTVSDKNPVYSASHNVLYGNLTYEEGAQDYYGTPMLTGKHLVLSLPNNDFSDASGSYTVEDGTVQIDAQAFRGNASLKHVNLPEGLKSINTGAFNGTTLDTVTLPESVETVKDMIANIDMLVAGPNVKDLRSTASHVVVRDAQGAAVGDKFDDITSYGNHTQSVYVGGGVPSLLYAVSAPSIVVIDESGLTSFDIEGMAFKQAADDKGVSVSDAVKATNIYVADEASRAVVEKAMRARFADMKNQTFEWAGKLPQDFDVDAWVKSNVHADYTPLTLGLYASDAATPGAKLSVTAASTGGIAEGKQYRFVEVASDGSEKVLKDWSDVNTLEWTVPEGGSATSLHAEVRDASYLTVAATEVQQGEPGVDDSALVKAIEGAKALEQGNKPEDAWNKLQDAIEAAQKVADDESATQQQVNDALAALRSAVSEFSGTPDVVKPLATLPGKVGAEAVTVEAEAGTLVNDASNDDGWPMKVADGQGASGGKFVDAVNQGDYVTYRLSAPVAGTYHASVLTQSGSGENNLDWALLEGDATEPVEGASGTVAGPEKGLSSWHAVEFDFKVSKAGDVTLRLAGGENGGPRLDSASFTLKEASEQPTPGDGKLQDGHTYEVPLVLDASQQYESYFHNYSGAFDGVKPATVTYKDGKYHVTITLGNGGAISQVKVGDTAAKQVTNDSVVSTWEVELDTLDDTTITMGNGIFEFSGPLGYDVDNAKDTTPEPEVDKKALTDAIAEAQKVEQGNKTTKAFKALQDAIAAVEKVAADDKADQKAVDDAVAALNKAVETFKASADKANKDALEAAVDAAGKVDLDRYYDGAEKEAFRKALESARLVLADGELTDQAKADAATKALTDAQAALRRRPTSGGGNGGATTPTTPSAGKVEASATANGSVTVDRQEAAKGETVTLTPRADEGYHVSSIKVTDKDGGAVAYAYRADGTFSFEMPEGQATVRVEFAGDAAKAFSDVDASMWQAAGVDFVSSRGIMSGYQNADGTDSGTFGVGDELTRGQFATLLHNHAQPGQGDAKADNETGLPDVLGGQYYTASVNWAVANGVINGYQNPDGSRTFGADDPVTLEQMVTIIANLKGADVSKADLSVLGRFVDGDAVSEWARPYVAWAVQAGVFSGSVEADGLRVRPTEAITRGRVATVLMKTFQEGILK